MIFTFADINQIIHQERRCVRFDCGHRVSFAELENKTINGHTYERGRNGYKCLLRASEKLLTAFTMIFICINLFTYFSYAIRPPAYCSVCAKVKIISRVPIQSGNNKYNINRFFTSSITISF